MLKKNLSLQQKFLLSIIIIVVPIIGLVFSWLEIQVIKQAKEESLDKARIISRQVILTRQWVTDCGGWVLVPRKSRGAENISCFYDERIKTEQGIFQRFTPSMVTKKLSLYSSVEKLYSFKISSLYPMNPANTASDFEKTALTGFIHKGKSEAYQFDENSLKYVTPLYMTQGCLKCHDKKTISHNNIMGGLSVTIPLKKLHAYLKKNCILLAAAGLTISFVTVLILFFLMRRMIIKPLVELEEKTKEISSGNLNARAAINTGDELERMGNSFNEMAQKIIEGRELLEKRVEQATEKLARANDDLKALDKLKSDFLANMSHELRSPITVITGGTNYLSRTLKQEDNRSYIEIIEKNITRLSRLVSDLFDFTKLEAGKIEWDFAEENLTLLVQEMIEITSTLAADKNLDVVFEASGDIFINIDFERIEQVIVNIMDNAIKYSDSGTKIIVTLHQKPGWATLSVQNQGIGIKAENIETIFDKFSTVPSGRNSATQGTGLGLAISRAIIEAHNGRIWAESIEGMSTTLLFTLPA
ncbi:MAG: ATP-binding protein [Thermodesulfobacteriota bacterium]|nr:ATP-binding protein [Thermodesulfobacteriota bacterium]